MIAPRIRCMAKVSKRISAVGLETLHRLDQADHPVGDQVGLVDVRGQPGARASGHELDQGRVGDHEPLPGAGVPPSLYLRQSSRSSNAFTSASIATPASVVFLTPADDSERTGFASRTAPLGCNLRGRETRVPQQLLDRPQVRPALQQMGREGVSQRVRRDATGDRGLSHPGSRRRRTSEDAGACRSSRQQRVLTPGTDGAGHPARGSGAMRAGRARRSGRSGSCRPSPRRGGAPRRSPVIASEVDHLLGAQPAGVGQLQHGAVAQLQWGTGRDPLQQGLHLVAGEDARKLAVPLGRRDQVGGLASSWSARSSAP